MTDTETGLAQRKMSKENYSKIMVKTNHPEVSVELFALFFPFFFGASQLPDVVLQDQLSFQHIHLFVAIEIQAFYPFSHLTVV